MDEMTGLVVREAIGLNGPLGLWVVWARRASGLERFAGPFDSSASALDYLNRLGLSALFPVEVR